MHSLGICSVTMNGNLFVMIGLSSLAVEKQSPKCWHCRCDSFDTGWLNSERGRFMKLRWLLLLGVILSVICQAGCGGGGAVVVMVVVQDPAPPGDLVAPFVISTNPTQNSTGVLVNRDISATFSEAIAPATLSSQTIVLIDDATDQTVPGYSIQYDASSKTVILSNADLEPASTYIVTLTTAIKDLAGNPMKASYNLRFSTYVPPPVNPPPGGSEDTTPPVVRSTFPVNNAPNVSLQTTLAASFSEALNPNTVNAQTFTLRRTVPLSPGQSLIPAHRQYSPQRQISRPAHPIRHSELCNQRPCRECPARFFLDICNLSTNG